MFCIVRGKNNCIIGIIIGKIIYISGIVWGIDNYMFAIFRSKIIYMPFVEVKLSICLL